MENMKRKIKKRNGTYDEIKEIRPVDFEDDLAEELKDPEFKKEFQKLGPKYALYAAVVESRHQKNISQKTLAKRLGTGQSAISRLESGKYNPTFEFMQKLAKALETDITITFSK